MGALVDLRFPGEASRPWAGWGGGPAPVNPSHLGSTLHQPFTQPFTLRFTYILSFFSIISIKDSIGVKGVKGVKG